MQPDLASYRLRLVHLTAVWAYGVGQPVFSLLQGNPEFLAIRGLTRVQVTLLAVSIAVGPPLVAVASEWLVAKASSWLANVLHAFVLFGFLVPVGLQVAKAMESPTPEIALLTVCAVALVGTAVYAVWHPARLFLSFSLVLPIVGLIWFVTGVPVATDDARAISVQTESRPPIVMVVLDELGVSSLMTPGGRIDAVRYPNFAHLARDGTWYRNATTVHDFTQAAVPAILTGQLPREGALQTYEDHPANLFTLLGGLYELNVHETWTRLCPLSLCPQEESSIPWIADGLYRDVAIALLHKVVPSSLLAPVPPPSSGHRDDAFNAFLSQVDVAARPGVMHFIHLLLPHSPWRRLPSGHMYGFSESVEGLREPEGVWIRDDWLVQQAYQRHLLQLEYTDSLLGRLLRTLEANRLYDPALVIVVADHGSSFRAGDSRRFVNRRNLADIAAVPMIIKYPHQRRARVVARAARTVDIVPTIADVLQTELPWEADGESLLKPPSGTTEVTVQSSGGAVTLPLAGVLRDVQASVDRKTKLFGQGSDSVFRIGTNRRCIGVRVVGQPTRSNAIRVDIQDADSFARVRLASPLVPARISGFVARGKVDRAMELAVSVNGRILALTKVFRAAAGQWFRVLVPLSAFREGYNRVDVLAVQDCADHRFVWLGGGPDRQS